MVAGSRKGFTLIELLVALVLLLMVSASFWSALATVQRTTRTQTEMAAMRGTVRGGLQIVASDLQELYANPTTGETDIIAMSATALRYKAMRGSGVICERSPTEVKIRRFLWAGLHDPTFQLDAGMFLFADDEADDDGDDEWLEVAITGATTSGTCPDGAAAFVVSVNITDVDDLDKLAKIHGGAPVRTYEEMELGLVTDAGRNWLGLRSVTASEAALLPLAGPLAAGGVNLTYWLADGVTATTAPAQVQSIRVLLVGQTDRAVNLGVSSTVQQVVDPLALRIQLRNSR